MSTTVYEVLDALRAAALDKRDKEGGGVFEVGSRATVAITLLVKDPAKTDPATIYYTEVADCLSREAKLVEVAGSTSVLTLPSLTITPNAAGDWIDQRSSDFDRFLPIGAKHGEDADDATIFSLYGRGLETGRDAWIYNASQDRLKANVALTATAFNAQISKFATYLAAHLGISAKGLVDHFIDLDPAHISWTLSLKNRLVAGWLVLVAKRASRRCRIARRSTCSSAAAARTACPIRE